MLQPGFIQDRHPHWVPKQHLRVIGRGVQTFEDRGSALANHLGKSILFLLGEKWVVWALLLWKASPRFGLALGEKLSKSLGCKWTSLNTRPVGVCLTLRLWLSLAARFHLGVCSQGVASYVTPLLVSIHGDRVWSYFSCEPLARILRWLTVRQLFAVDTQ